MPGTFRSLVNEETFRRTEASARSKNRIREEEKVAKVLAARDARLAAIERGEPLPAPEYLPGPLNMIKFHLWSLVAFDHFLGDGRLFAWSNISFHQHWEEGTCVYAEVDPDKPVGGMIYLDPNNAWDFELFKSPERFMEPFPLTTQETEPTNIQCTLIDEDHVVVQVPAQLFRYNGDGKVVPAPDGVPDVIELFGIRDRDNDENLARNRQRFLDSLAAAAAKKEKARKRRKRLAKRAH